MTISLAQLINVQTVESIEQRIKDNFIKQRKRQKLSRQKLAQKAGINIGIIRRFEANGYISLKNLVILSFALGCENELLELFTNNKPTNLFDEN